MRISEFHYSPLLTLAASRPPTPRPPRTRSAQAWRPSRRRCVYTGRPAAAKLSRSTSCQGWQARSAAINERCFVQLFRGPLELLARVTSSAARAQNQTPAAVTNSSCQPWQRVLKSEPDTALPWTCSPWPHFFALAVRVRVYLRLPVLLLLHHHVRTVASLAALREEQQRRQLAEQGWAKDTIFIRIPTLSHGRPPPNGAAGRFDIPPLSRRQSNATRCPSAVFVACQVATAVSVATAWV